MAREVLLADMVAESPSRNVLRWSPIDRENSNWPRAMFVAESVHYRRQTSEPSSAMHSSSAGRRMKVLNRTDESAMLAYWRDYERIPPERPVRPDILHADFPQDAVWYRAQIEARDILRLFMISVHDFGPISCNTWLLATAAQNYAQGFKDPDHTLRIQKLLARESFDPRLIVVADSLDGPYTIIDGNHRAIILAERNQLIGQECFLGIHPRIRQFNHAGMAYRNRRSLGAK